MWILKDDQAEGGQESKAALVEEDIDYQLRMEMPGLEEMAKT